MNILGELQSHQAQFTFRQGRIAESAALYQASLALLRPFAESDILAQTFVFNGVVSWISGEVHQAWPYLKEALAVANSVDVGLSASLVTRDLKKAMIYAERIEAGVVKINQISTGLALQAPFGGVKKSSTDSFKEQGPQAVEFYSRLKTVYLDYSA